MRKTNKNAGFSLIELLVVIAIMAVLAGVGVAGYSVYTAEAEKAADNQLIAVINEAFAGACWDNDDDIHWVTSATIKLVDQKVAEINKYAEDFWIHFGDNANATFYRVKGLYFDANDHAFKAIPEVYADLLGSFDAELINKVMASSFMTAEGLGVDNLMGKVDFITNLAASLADQEANNGAWQMLSAYNMKMFEDLGIVIPDDFADLDEDEQARIMAPLQQLVNDKIAVLDTQNIDGWDTMTDDEKSQYAQNVILGNYAVLDAAKGMKGQDPATVLNTIQTTSDFKTLILNSENEDGVAQASAAYGLFTAYAHSLPEGNERTAALAKINDPVALLSAMNDSGFRAYLTTPEAATDLAGYMAAMEMVDSSASNEDAVYNLMVNGFTDPALLAVIQQQLQ